jgi:hypothetical protein
VNRHADVYGPRASSPAWEATPALKRICLREASASLRQMRARCLRSIESFVESTNHIMCSSNVPFYPTTYSVLLSTHMVIWHSLGLKFRRAMTVISWARESGGCLQSKTNTTSHRLCGEAPFLAMGGLALMMLATPS